jgi:signal transduction histidine kinase
MKTTATNRLNRTYLQKLDWQNYFATGAAILIITLSFLWMLLHVGGDHSVTFFSDVMYTVADWIGASWAFLTAYRARYGPLRLEPRHQLAWLLTGLGLFSDGLGGIYFTYLEQLGQSNPTPSYGDIAFTLFYPLVFIGLLLMPAEQDSQRSRLRIGLDACITTLCILGVTWYFFIGPVFVLQKSAHIPILSVVMVMSYPFWDMLLVLALVLLIWRRVEPALRPSLFLYAGGILSLTWADMTYAYSTALGTYTSGTFYIDTFWFIGSLAAGLSGLYQYMALVRRALNQSTLPAVSTESFMTGALSGEQAPFRGHDKMQRRRLILLQSFLIYLPLSVLLVFTLYSEITNDNEISFFLVVLTAIVGILVTIRYLFATQQNEILLREREQEREAAEHSRLLAAELNEVLELDPLLDRIVTLATSALGFDAAMLILIENYNEPSQDDHYSLLARAAISNSPKTVVWSFQGTQSSYAGILSGNALEVTWEARNPILPAELHSWQQQQRIQATLFVPLMYHGKVQGCIGFSSRTTPHFSQHDSHITEAFAEQAATAIEHARLYQEARERELFANAMVNIAVRLNSALAAPSEIHELICTEGANALQADYALLYVPDNNRQLVLLNAFVSEQEAFANVPPKVANTWPPIRPYEYEFQALSSLQPMLIKLDQVFPLLLAPPASAATESSPGISSNNIPSWTTTTENTVNRTPPGVYSSGRITSGGIRRRVYTLREALAQRFVYTAILAPLTARNEPIGLLILARSIRPGTHDKKSFTLADLPHAQDFAEQASIAFTNAHLYQSLRDAHQRQQDLDHLKDQFMITASHELRTPLTAVQGYLELLAQYDDILPPAQRQEFFQKAQRGCDELVLLLGNVMDASQLELETGLRPAHIERVSVREMIQSVVDLIEPHTVQQRREVRLDIPVHLTVQADPGRLRQVLLNLSINALKYSEPGTPIVFSARAVMNSVPTVVISVIDKGKGIAPQDQALLFQRFFRLERDVNSPVRGTGLGLYISRRLIEGMGGKIGVDSSGIEGAGSIFYIQLPLPY